MGVGWLLISQAAPEPGSWIDLLDRGGLLTLLVICVWAFSTRRVISRGTYDELVKERDLWRQIALRNQNVAEKATEVVKETVA